jgi:hypothetical protein
LVAAGYSVFSFSEWLKNIIVNIRHPQRRTRRAQKLLERQKAGDLKTAESLYYRYLYPNLFTENDRRETLTILRVGVSVALFVIGIIYDGTERWLLLVIGVLMFYNSYTGIQHVHGWTDRTLRAAKMAEEHKVPVFQWSRGGKSLPPS